MLAFYHTSSGLISLKPDDFEAYLMQSPHGFVILRVEVIICLSCLVEVIIVFPISSASTNPIDS